jgi:hypothetical protein
MQVGKISSYDLQKNFTGFYSEMVGTTGSGFFYFLHRVIHNTEQIIRVQHRDGSSGGAPPCTLKYWNMDGTPAAQFTVGSGGISYKNIIDITWLQDEQKFVYLTMDPSLVIGNTYSMYKCDATGSNPSLMVSGFDGDGQWANWWTTAVSGYVGLASTKDNIFVKVGANLYKFNQDISGDWASIKASVPKVTNAFHYGNGVGCRNLAFQPASGTTSSGYLIYSWYDTAIDSLYVRSIDCATMAYVPTRWAMLSINDYGYAKEPLFINQLDPSSLHYIKPASYAGPTTVTGVTASGSVSSEYRAVATAANLNVFNIDSNLAAFLNVNSSDTVMPAGIGAQADIIANVANCWGTTLSGKLVQFWVSSGDGGVFPAWAYTDGSGKAYTKFTTGANVGISNVAVVVNEI